MLSPSTVPECVPPLAEGPGRPAPERFNGASAVPVPSDPVPSDPVSIDVVFIDPVAQPARFSAAISAAAMAAVREVADFTAEQLKSQADRVRAWSTARSLSDIVNREWAFAAETFSACVHEAIHLQQVMAEAAREADRAHRRQNG